MVLFPKILGQEHAKKILSALYERKHFPPLLFIGPKGVGKRTVAINFAQVINCPSTNDINLNQCQRCQQFGNLVHPDIKIIFPVSTSNSTDANESKAFEEIADSTPLFAIGQLKPFLPTTNLIPIKVIRWLKQEMAYKPLVSPFKVIIILNADKMNIQAANAFLKTLEEPQEQTLFILTTERLSNILPTIRSRCQTIRFSTLSKDVIIEYLIKEKQISAVNAKLAAEISEGSLRKAVDFHYQSEEFLPIPDLLNLCDHSQKSSLESLNIMTNFDTESVSSEKLIISFLFVYRKALQFKLSIPMFYNTEIIKKISSVLTIEQIISRISLLLNMLNDAEIHLNKKLFLFSILSAVRF